MKEALIAAIAEALEDAAMYDTEYDYGFGGETVEYQRVSNWFELAAEALTVVVDTLSEP